MILPVILMDIPAGFDGDAVESGAFRHIKRDKEYAGKIRNRIWNIRSYPAFPDNRILPDRKI